MCLIHQADSNGSFQNKDEGPLFSQNDEENLKFTFLIGASFPITLDELTSFLKSQVCTDFHDTINSAQTVWQKNNTTVLENKQFYETGCKQFIDIHLIIKVPKNDSSLGTEVSFSVASDDDFLKNVTAKNLELLKSTCFANNLTVEYFNRHVESENKSETEFGNLENIESVVACLKKLIEVAALNVDLFSRQNSEGCHELLSDWNPLLDVCKFWLEGISLCAIGFFGLCGNTLALVVLGSTKDSNR